MKLTGTGLIAAVALAGLAALGVYLYSKRAAILTAINPADSQNLINRGVTSVVTAATGRDESLGGWFYDLTHKNPLTLDPGPAITPASLDYRGG